MKKKVKIIATIGPVSDNKRILDRLYLEGMNISRINTKFGSIQQYEKILNNLKGKRCEIMFDIKKLKILEWIKNQKCDYLAISFAESVNQIKKVKKILGKRKIKIISKIETKKGIKNIENLIKMSDGIMVARGDLGRNIKLEKVPITQKIIIRRCNQKRKMVITATEMLLSMVNSKTPGRAEVSDIANAVIDGSDALMLSEETAIGRYPIESLKKMKKVIKETQKMSKMLQ